MPLRKFKRIRRVSALIYIHHVNLLSESIHTKKQKREPISVNGREIGPGVHAEKQVYVCVCACVYIYIYVHVS